MPKVFFSFAEKYYASHIGSKVKQRQGGPSNAAGRLHGGLPQGRSQTDGSHGKAIGFFIQNPAYGSSFFCVF